ncbi:MULTISPECIES: hypothetical protein [unclassified Wolbachia]|uniref:hypothetical protein n=1 Tax=unclassified Wolbachia TaxID=2640676 RepID=UPI00222F0BC6|nr:hypothetical protein [Wolbachia endosymbiont (group A) of Apoderus coryli]
MNFVSSHQIFSVAMQQSPLGSRCKSICKLCNGQLTLGVYVKTMFVSWIPVSRTGMTSIVNVLHLFYCLMEHLNNHAWIWMTKGLMND